MQTKRFLDAETAGQVFTKAQQHIQRDTEVLIIPSLVLKIPLLTPDLRRKLAHVIKYSLLTTPDLPPIYAEYLCSILSSVSVRTKTAADLLCTHKLSFPTGQLPYMLNHEKCNCAELAEQCSIPLVDGHCFARTVQNMSQFFGPHAESVLGQNLKNATIPHWLSVTNQCE